MDNYFRGCPAVMDDGRLFTDYRSSQVREELFRHRNCIISENEARTLRIDNGARILDTEWNHIRRNKSCFPQKHCYHSHPATRVSTIYNNSEILAYNGQIPRPRCNKSCHDYRATETPGSRRGRPGCEKKQVVGSGYPLERCPQMCKRSRRLLPDNLRKNE